MGRDDVHAVVAEVIAELAVVPVDTVTPQARLEDLDVDSITKVEMIVMLRSRLGLEIPDEVGSRVVSVGDVMDCLVDLSERAATPPVE